MDMIMVGLILAGAVFFTLRSFVRIYRGQKACNCSAGCPCLSGQERFCSATNDEKGIEKGSFLFQPMVCKTLYKEYKEKK